MEKKSYFVTFVYSKNFHGREPGYFVDHGEGVGYDLQLEGIQYTSSLEETEHDIVEYAKNYTNKENPLFGFHTFELRKERRNSFPNAGTIPTAPSGKKARHPLFLATPKKNGFSRAGKILTLSRATSWSTTRPRNITWALES